MFELTDISFVKRIVVGDAGSAETRPEKESETAMALVNRCLSDHPRGRIIGIERTSSSLNMGEHQIILETIVYHIGFARKPLWLVD